jgi:tripartite-type tricarboxylate transporter receptor subunit TctC
MRRMIAKFSAPWPTRMRLSTDTRPRGLHRLVQRAQVGVHHAALPDVPTVAEQGFPGFEMTQWYGLLAPASLPQPAANEKLAADSAIGVGGTPGEFAKFIASEQQCCKLVVARATIKPD